MFYAHVPAGKQGEWRSGMLPHSSLPFFAAWRDTLIVGDLGSTTLSYYTAAGRLVREIALPRLDPIRGADLAAARRDALALERDPVGKAALGAFYDAAERARLRIWDRLVVADDGTLWLGVADANPRAAPRYLVLAPSGAVRAVWRFPAASRLLAVSGGVLVLALKDADDVERIGLVRP
jgi:hypothetical protein